MMRAVKRISRYGIGSGLAAADAVVKASDQFRHPEVLVQAPAQEIDYIDSGISKIFASVLKWWDKVGEIALIRFSRISYESTSQNIHHQGVTWTVNPELVQCWLELSGKTELCCRPVVILEENSQLVHQSGRTAATELRTLVRSGCNQRNIVIKKFSQFRDTMADDVLK